MQIRSLLKASAALLFGLLTVSSLMISYYLTQLDQGLAHNVQAAEALIEAQRAIDDHNLALNDMVVTTDRIGQGMERLTGHSSQIHRNVRGMAAANLATLELNRGLEGSGGVTPTELRRILVSLRNMNASAESIRDYLGNLRDTAGQDVDRLEAISAITARMNTRIPGW